MVRSGFRSNSVGPLDNEEIHFKVKCLLMLMLCVNSFLMINFSLKCKHCLCSQNIAPFETNQIE